jgi:heme exporter protein B
MFWRLLGRELLLSVRHGGDTLAAVMFFVLAGALFPLAIGPAPEVLARLAPGVVWVCALLAALLPLDRLFGADGEDGSLDQLLLCGLPASLVALAKAIAHWLVTGVPLLIAAAPLALMLRMQPDVCYPVPPCSHCWAAPQPLSSLAPGAAACCCRFCCCRWRCPC